MLAMPVFAIWMMDITNEEMGLIGVGGRVLWNGASIAAEFMEEWRGVQNL